MKSESRPSTNSPNFRAARDPPGLIANLDSTLTFYDPETTSSTKRVSSDVT